MKIWVDADACPKAVKEILFRAAHRREVSLTLVANQALSIMPSPFINAVQVPSGFDVADNYIAQNMKAGDLVITADIPLAAEVIERDGRAISPRGEKFTKNNIKQRLTMRNFMEDMRSAGQVTGGSPPLGQADKQAFANALDTLLTRLLGKS